MATHKLQITLDEATGAVTVRHFVAFEIEPEEGKPIAVRHHEDPELPAELAAELKAVLERVAQIERKGITRRAKGHAARHEYYAHVLPAEIKEGKARRLESGKIEGASAPPKDPKE